MRVEELVGNGSLGSSNEIILHNLRNNNPLDLLDLRPLSYNWRHADKLNQIVSASGARP